MDPISLGSSFLRTKNNCLRAQLRRLHLIQPATQRVPSFVRPSSVPWVEPNRSEAKRSWWIRRKNEQDPKEFRDDAFPKFNMYSPWKNDGKGRRSFPFGSRYMFKGRTVKLPGGLLSGRLPLEEHKIFQKEFLQGWNEISWNSIECQNSGGEKPFCF